MSEALAENKPTMLSTEETSKPEVSQSLADRITAPTTEPVTEPTDASKESESAAAQPAPATTSWADEVASPLLPGAEASQKDEVKKDGSGADGGAAQADGAGVVRNGSQLQEPEYDVEVKLSDIQADPNNPLYSVKSFEELGGL